MEYSARNIKYQQNSFDLRGTQKFVWLISSDTSSFKLERMQETDCRARSGLWKVKLKTLYNILNVGHFVRN